MVTVCQPILICSKAARLYNCAIAMAREYVGILTSEEVPGDTTLAEVLQLSISGGDHVPAPDQVVISWETSELECSVALAVVRETNS